MAKGVADEGCEGHFRKGEGAIHIVQSEGVVPAEREITQTREEERSKKSRARNEFNMIYNLVDMIGTKLGV